MDEAAYQFVAACEDLTVWAGSVPASRENKMGTKLTAQRLKEVLHYDPETGIFTWRLKIANKVRVGTRAGQIKSSGYRLIGIDGGRYLEHVLAVLYMTGEFPRVEVDHDNRVRSDNRWGNLTCCTHAENHQNRGATRTNSSGFVGVGWHRLRQCWRATLGLRGKQIHLGLFETAEAAHEAYKQAKKRYHQFKSEVTT